MKVLKFFDQCVPVEDPEMIDFLLLRLGCGKGRTWMGLKELKLQLLEVGLPYVLSDGSP